MSILIRESVESNISSERALANCVFPTPVEPKKMNVPIGFFGSLSPTLFLCIALDILVIASSCPIIFFFMLLDILDSFFISLEAILCTGIPVINETTSATLSPFTIILLDLISFSHCFFASLSSFIEFFS